MRGERIIRFFDEEICKFFRTRPEPRLHPSSWVFITTESENYHPNSLHPYLEAVTATKRREIHSKTRRERRIQQIQWALALVITLYLLRHILIGVFHHIWVTVFAMQVPTPRSLQHSQIDVYSYSFFVNDGDRWLEQEHYHNAIFQYKKALELFPSNDAQFRLARAYSYHCQYNDRDCEAGLALIQQLEENFPLSTELENLKMIFLPPSAEAMGE